MENNNQSGTSEKLKDYLQRELKKGTISFVIATHDYQNGNHWYIHPENKAGETFDIYFDEIMSDIKSATAILSEHGIDIMKLDDNFNTQLLHAMERYAKQHTPSGTSEKLYMPIPVKERVPDLSHYINDRLILLDDYYDVLKVVGVGIMTEWEAIKGRAEYWLEKTDAPSIQDKDAEIERLKGLIIEEYQEKMEWMNIERGEQKYKMEQFKANNNL